MSLSVQGDYAVPHRLTTWTGQLGLDATIASMIGGGLGWATHALGIDAMIGRLLAIIPEGGAVVPWGAIIGGFCGVAVAIIHTRSRERALKLKHQQAMEIRRFDHETALSEAERLRNKLARNGFSAEDSDVDDDRD